MKDEIGKMALMGDVWYQIVDIRKSRGEIEYSFSPPYAKNYWIPKSWVKNIKDRE